MNQINTDWELWLSDSSLPRRVALLLQWASTRVQVGGSFSGAQQQALVLALVIWRLLPLSSHAASPGPAVTSSSAAAAASSWFFPVSVCSAGFSVWAFVHTRVSYWLVLELGFWLLTFSQIVILLGVCQIPSAILAQPAPVVGSSPAILAVV